MLQSLIKVYQDKCVSGLLGNLSLLHIPKLLQWENIEDSEKENIVNEVAEALNLLVEFKYRQWLPKGKVDDE